MMSASLLVSVLLIGGGREVSAVEPADLTPDQKAWALATSAVLWERNGDRHDLLAGRELTEANRHDRGDGRGEEAARSMIAAIYARKSKDEAGPPCDEWKRERA